MKQYTLVRVVYVVTIVILVFAAFVSQVSAGGSVILPRHSVALATDCSPIGDNLTTFYVEPSYPAWYDGGVTVSLAPSGQSWIVTTDRPISGAIALGDSRERIYLAPALAFTVAIGSPLRSLIVCYQ
jgi:hypothetical protein